MKKRILTIVLAAVMCMGLVLGATLTASAADEVTTLADLQTAINAGGTVKLGAGIDLGNTNLTFPDNTPVTIDLNGKKLSKSQSGFVMTIEAADKVTITDSVGTGSVEKAGGWYFFDNYGDLRIEGGTYNKSGYDLVYTNDSSVTEITGGVFVLENIIARQSTDSTATISNGNFTVSTVSTGIWNSGITITGGTFSIDPTTYGVDTQKYTVTKNADNTYTVGEAPVTYTVSVTASSTTGGTVTGGNTYEENASVTVTATANDGYKFVKWTENSSDVSTDASYTFTVAADRTLVAVFKQIEYVTVNLKSPSGLDTEIKIDIEATVADLKDAVAAKANVTFGDNSVYRLFGEDIRYPNSKLDDDTKILGDIGFANGQTIHLEKDDTAPWDTSEAPIKIFGLTITGGTGAQEPYGAYSDADYQWNYAYKTITLTGCASGANVTISGTAEEGTHIVVRSSTWRYLTLDGVSMNADYPCITVNASAKLDLTIKGTNTLVSSSRTENGNTYKFPAICLNQSKSQLRINDGGGMLTATSICDGMPGIGTTGDDQSVGKITINGGTITASGGKGAPGVRSSSLYMKGGKLTANGGTDSTSDIYIYGTDTKSIQIIKSDGPVIVADTVVANVNGYVNINEGTNIKKLTAPDVYFNVDTNTEVTGNAWYPITDNASSSNGSLAYTAGTTDSMNRPTIYGKAGDTVSFTITPTEGYAVDTVCVNDSPITEGQGIYTFTMPTKAVSVTATYCDAYNVWVGGVQVTESNASDLLGDGTVKYDNATGTLTLTDATITNTNGEGIKVIGSDITIVGVDTDAEGSNTISGSTTAVYGSANITMKGTFGDITGGTNGAIYSVVGSSSSYPGGNIHIEEDTVIGNISSSWYTLQADKGDIIIDGEVGNVSGESGFAAAIDGDIVINGKVGNVDGIEYGIYAHKTITVAEGAEIGNITSEGMAGIISFESDITVNGRVGDISGSTYGVYATGNITVNENAEIGNVSATSSAAIAALQGNVTVSGKVGDISGGSYGIYAGGNVTVGGTVGTVESTKYGIRAVNGKITIGSVIGPISVSSSDDDTTVMAVVAAGGIDLADNIEVKTPVSNRVGLYGTSNYTVYDTVDTEDTADDTVARTVEFSEIYSITYELNNGMINGEHATEYVPGQLVTLPTKVIRSGYSFQGWYDNAEFDGEAVTEITAEESGDKTFYAKWQKKATGTVVTKHKCTSVCEVCGGCTDAKCTKDVCDDKCLETSMAFQDVAEDAWYAESVKYVYHHGIMKGVSDTEFDVGGSTTRAMIVTTLWRLEGEPVVNYAMTFADVKADAWYAEAVRWAAEKGLVLGYSAEEFRPDTAITREQMAAIIYRYAEYKNVAPTGAWAIRLEYADISDIADYATEAVMYCTMKNLMQGRDGGVFAPQDTATRAEIAVVLHRFIVNNK